jgi:Cdc6-like AAA superfamily ATPase
MGDLSLEDIHDPFILVRRLFLPSTPIREISRLYGREAQVEKVRRELRSPGRSVFIFGERGVGKTSLAQTVAHLEDTSDLDPALIGCYQADFSQVITRVARHLMGLQYYERNLKKKVTELKIGGAVGHILHRVETHPTELVRIEPLYAVALLKQLAPKGATPVVVLDELDLAGAGLKQDLAHFVKQVGDEDCPVKFIFAGPRSQGSCRLG